MVEVVKAPNDWREARGSAFIFLGGSIEMGKAEDWQTRLTNCLDDINCVVLNPRRDDWDSSWIQDPTPGTQFHQQVEWELQGQEVADVIVYYFVPGTQSPITLLELGLHANDFDTRVIVYCPKEFWRYGNVKMVCQRYGIKCHEDETHFIDDVRHAIEEIYSF